MEEKKSCRCFQRRIGLPYRNVSGRGKKDMKYMAPSIIPVVVSSPKQVKKKNEENGHKSECETCDLDVTQEILRKEPEIQGIRKPYCVTVFSPHFCKF